MKELDDIKAKAERFLRTAQRALDIGDYDSCASRCYYAMFFMTEAVLLTKGITASSHKGVISLFGRHFVRTGIFPKETGKALTEAYDKRLIGDYGVGLALTENEARGLLERAEGFIREIERYIETAGRPETP